MSAAGPQSLVQIKFNNDITFDECVESVLVDDYCVCDPGTRGWFARRQCRSVADRRFQAATTIQKGNHVID